MALSPYKSHQSSLNRSRSSSCSSPIRNRVVYHEIFSVGANTLFRSFSCDQVFDKDEKGQPFQATKIQVSSFITPEKKIYETRDLKDRDVKTAPKRLGLITPNHNTMAKKRLKMNSAPPVMSNTGSSIAKNAIKYCLIPLLCSCVFYLYITYKECSYVWDLERTENELKENVLGQNNALAKINTILNMCNSSKDVLTMVFTGGVGVGKTYSSSIISRNFPWSSNKLIPFSDTFERDLKNFLDSDFSICGCNLVIFDDLSVANFNDAINLLKLLHNKKSNNEKLLLILIFQVHTEKDRNEIIRKFKNSYVSVYHVPFNNLGEDIVEECFKREISRQDVHIPRKELSQLIKDKMSHIDIVKGPTGCKGVADEVSSYYKKNRN